ncbi:BT_3987 domain-containing protein [Proteiniphilum sp. X52]|uniref:BT_3987 domain-containing protein n=1 Tax=Proteiniphilum sp. X52 TaxID=2382159 RepID=UPI001314FA4C|nr:DUF1735 domain-containing protein [Proteiniphilum sp. X52]
MRKIQLFVPWLMVVSILFSACEVVDPLASEQYRKEVYIVGAYDNVFSVDLPFGDNEDTYISVAVSGSQRIDRDVKVTFKQNDGLVEWYNNRFMLDRPVKYQLLDTELVSVPSWSTTIKAGEIYARLPFKIKSTGLHCDSLYAVSFEIESVSDYMKSEEDASLILTLNLTNDYSGGFQLEATKSTLVQDENGEWIEMGLPVPVSIQRTLTAVSENAVRFFHDKERETYSEYTNSYDPGGDYFRAIDNFCVVFERMGETNDFSVHPWKSMSIVDGEATFGEKGFTFWYDYMQGTTRYRMKGAFTK